MWKSTARAALAVVFVGASIASTQAVAEYVAADPSNLPATIRAQLDQRYRGWRLYDLSAQPDSLRVCGTVNSAAGSIVVGDFNGDKAQDYAVLIQYGRTTVPILFVKTKAGFRPYELIPPDQHRPSGADLLFTVHGGESEHVLRPYRGGGFEDGGERHLKSDGVEVSGCGSWATTFFIRKGKIDALVNGD